MSNNKRMGPLPPRVIFGFEMLVLAGVAYGAGVLMTNFVASDAADNAMKSIGSPMPIGLTMLPAVVGAFLAWVGGVWGVIQATAGLIEYLRELFKQP